MKSLFLILILILFTLHGCTDNSQGAEHRTLDDLLELNTTVTPGAAQSFKTIWNIVKSDSLKVLPQNSVSYTALFTLFRNLILEDAQRTLVDTSDILPYFDKLAHPNGVCLKGIWKIDTENPYGGLFRGGSESLVIARASSAMTNTKKGEIRAFGLAVKLFGTLDPQQAGTHPTANFFVIDDLGGTLADYFSDVALTNEPDISTNSEVLNYALYALKVADAFKEADQNPNIRQLYKVSELDEANTTAVLTPKWIKIQAQAGQTKTDAEDFRDEFALEDGETLVYVISVASTIDDGVKQWQAVGTITFDSSIVSISCDHRLHFQHPLWRDDLRHTL